MAIETSPYGVRDDGEEISRITLDNGRLRAVFIDDGARLLELHVPDRNGAAADIVLGYPDIAAQVAGAAYFGATCGRYGNRIRRGRFRLDGRDITVDVNEGANHLHGGARGFDRHRWPFTVDESRDVVRFTLTSPDGDQGFPGRLDVAAEYALTDAGLRISMTGVSDAPTILNMVHHSYWNLAGHAGGNVLDQEIQIEADFFTPVDDELLPTGEIRSVAGTPFDFRRRRPIGAAIRDVDHGGAGRGAPAGFAGYDHNWVVRGPVGELRDCATAYDAASGRIMRLRTNDAAVQFYTGGYLDDVGGKEGVVYRPFQGFTLETQRYPDSPNFGHFPSSRLDPGQRYENILDFAFSSDAVAAP